MKRLLFIPYIIIALLLSGCSGNVFSSRRDMEHLLPIQTISVDRAPGGVVFGVSSGIGPDKAAPLVMKCAASGIEPAIERLQEYSPEDELFYAHTRYILLGETMAGSGILPLLDWVERNPAIRLDTSLILVRGSAADLLIGTSGQTTDITENLDSLAREERFHGRQIYTMRQIAASLLERGCALCLAAEAVPTEGVIYMTASEASSAISPIGYALLREGEVPVYLTPEESLGAALFEGEVGGAHVEVDGGVLELFSDGAQVSGLWDDGGELAGILVRCTLRAGLIEQKAGRDADARSMEEDFSRAAQGWLEAAAARSQALGCDFLHLREAVLRDPPGGARIAGGWDALFPALPVTVIASGEVDRDYDLSSKGDADS